MIVKGWGAMTKDNYKRTRLKDIAEIAEVSVATVSIILKDPNTKRFSTETKRQIIDLAKSLNYTPNMAARSLVQHKTFALGLIIPDLSNPFFANLAKKIETLARAYNYTVLMVNSDEHYENDIKLFDSLFRRNMDGIILAASANSYGHEGQINRMIDLANIPTITIDRSLKDYKGSQVVFDNKLGTYIATEHCIEKGHRNIGFISTRETSLNGYFRHEGYREAMLENQLEYDESKVFFGGVDFKTGYDAADVLIKQNVTAVVASNDLNAYGFKKRAEALGYRIPHDISIVGFDNLEMNDYISEGITSIDLNVDAMAKRTIEIMIQMIEEKDFVERLVLKPKLYERDSVIDLNKEKEIGD